MDTLLMREGAIIGHLYEKLPNESKSTKEIMNLQFYSEGLRKDVTIKRFLIEILKMFLRDGELFPNDWNSDLILCLIENEIIQGVIDTDGYIDDYSEKEFVEVMHDLCEVMLNE